MLTAFSGWMVFGEKLPGMWWVGAAGLVVGNVVIGRREEEGEGGKVSVLGSRAVGEEQEEQRERYRDRQVGEDGDGLGTSDRVGLVEQRVKGVGER